MAVPLTGRVLLDTNVFIDYLRDGRYGELVWGGEVPRFRFLSAVVLFELRLGANTARRRRAVDRIHAAFPPERVLAPTPRLFDRAGLLFQRLHRNSARRDRLGPANDVLIALTAWHAGASVVTSNVREFRRIAGWLPGLSVVPPIGEAV